MVGIVDFKSDSIIIRESYNECDILFVLSFIIEKEAESPTTSTGGGKSSFSYPLVETLGSS